MLTILVVLLLVSLPYSSISLGTNINLYNGYIIKTKQNNPHIQYILIPFIVTVFNIEYINEFGLDVFDCDVFGCIGVSKYSIKVLLYI
jgi:hypothetical protein